MLSLTWILMIVIAVNGNIIRELKMDNDHLALMEEMQHQGKDPVAKEDVEKELDSSTEQSTPLLHDWYLFKHPMNRKTCYEDDSDTRCSLKELRGYEQESMYVVPRGKDNAKCIKGTEYKYQVFPGREDKLLVYFQGGGGCPDFKSTVLGLCRTLAGQPHFTRSGIFDRKNPSNPYRDYTLLQVNYCSGDIHTGNVTRDYVYPISKSKVEQYGAVNVDVTLQWMERQNFTLETLVIAGSSAGSLAVQWYAHHLLKTMKYRSAAVILDSFSNASPLTEPQVLRMHGLCTNNRIFTDRPFELEKCNQGKLTTHDMFVKTVAEFPTVNFVAINSKEDFMQLKFYATVSDQLNLLFTLGPEEFYQMVVRRYKEYSKFPNFVTYFTSTPFHILLIDKTLYNTYPNGIQSEEDKRTFTPQGMPLATFLSQFPVQLGSTASSECFGRLTSADNLNLRQCSVSLLQQRIEGAAPRFANWKDELYHRISSMLPKFTMK